MRATLFGTTAAIALGLATFAAPATLRADDTTQTEATTTAPATAVDAEKLIGQNIVNPAGETVGEIQSVVIDQDGTVRHVIVGVGGFLGVGERNVALPWESLTISDNGETVVAAATKEQLEAMPEHRYPESVTGGVYSYDQDLTANPYLAENSTADVDTAADADTTADVDTMENTTMESNTAPAAGTVGDFRASQLVGVTVVNSAGETIGEINELLLAREGNVDGVVVDVGGFLGMGERPVLISWNDIQLADQNADDKLEATTSMTKEQLNALPVYEDSAAQ
ncbi:MAG: PRC-barrel domain-containing protein [Hyphomicrobium sp.]|uniref:PRC-barrel domain-containing protein n=1 Tax=Hyphomicrobium sp. TaxID=82 RepID=UPI003D14A635